MTIVTRTIALLGTAGVLVWAPTQGAAQTQADFDACNQQASATTSSPSASPHTVPGGSMTSPGTGADSTRQPGADSHVGSGTGSSGSGAMTIPGGASGGTGPYGSGTTSGGMHGSTNPSGSGTSSSSMSGASGPATDQQLQGMAAAGLSNEMYKQAYRDCMRSRGF